MLLLCLLLTAQGEVVARRDVWAYLGLADQYRTYRALQSDAAVGASRQSDAVVETIRTWSAGEIGDAQRALRSNERGLRSGAAEDGSLDLRLVEAAALMHVEAGLRELQRPNEADGVVQLAAAARLVGWTASVAAERQRRRRSGSGSADAPGSEPPGWRLAPRLTPAALHTTVAAAALAVGFPEIAERHAQEGRRFDPTDPMAVLTAGCAHEGLAHLRELADARQDALDRRDRAVRAYSDALAMDPAVAEARLRLGRLLAEQGRLVEAEPLLERVVEVDGDGRQRYLALLFLARAAEKRKETRRAGELYSRALDAKPDGSAARLGLALQLERQAGAAAARTLVVEALSRSRRLDTEPDPWSSYLFGQTEVAAAELKRLWERVLGP